MAKGQNQSNNNLTYSLVKMIRTRASKRDVGCCCPGLRGGQGFFKCAMLNAFKFVMPEDIARRDVLEDECQDEVDKG